MRGSLCHSFCSRAHSHSPVSLRKFLFVMVGVIADSTAVSVPAPHPTSSRTAQPRCFRGHSSKGGALRVPHDTVAPSRLDSTTWLARGSWSCRPVHRVRRCLQQLVQVVAARFASLCRELPLSRPERLEPEGLA